MTNEDAIRVFESWIEQDKNLKYADRLENIEIYQIAIEALKAQRPHGKWEFVGENLFMCTHCGYSAKGDYLREWSVRTFDNTFPDFCPNCGASMQANDRQVTGKLDEDKEEGGKE